MQAPQKIVDRIQKLLNSASSFRQMGSIQEAEAFLAAANDLLLQYNLSLGEIPEAEREQIKIGKNTIIYHDNQAGSRWRKRLMQILTESFFCTYVYWANRSNANATYVDIHRADIIGRLENVETVVYMFNNLTTQLLNIAQDAYKAIPQDARPSRYGYLKDFLNGACSGFESKMQQQRDEQEIQHGSALSGLILYNAAAIDKYKQAEYPNTKKGKRLRNIEHNPEAYQKGYKAGSEIQTSASITAPTQHLELA